MRVSEPCSVTSDHRGAGLSRVAAASSPPLARPPPPGGARRPAGRPPCPPAGRGGRRAPGSARAFLDTALDRVAGGGVRAGPPGGGGSRGVGGGGRGYLCSNNYLGLANPPHLREAAHASIERLGGGPQPCVVLPAPCPCTTSWRWCTNIRVGPDTSWTANRANTDSVG